MSTNRNPAFSPEEDLIIVEKFLENADVFLGRTPSRDLNVKKREIYGEMVNLVNSKRPSLNRTKEQVENRLKKLKVDKSKIIEGIRFPPTGNKDKAPLESQTVAMQMLVDFYMDKSSETGISGGIETQSQSLPETSEGSICDEINAFQENHKHSNSTVPCGSLGEKINKELSIESWKEKYGPRRRVVIPEAHVRASQSLSPPHKIPRVEKLTERDEITMACLKKNNSLMDLKCQKCVYENELLQLQHKKIVREMEIAEEKYEKEMQILCLEEEIKRRKLQ